MQVQIYTDGSCHTQLKIGGWAAVILWKKEKIELVGHQLDTTHNAMELLSVIQAIDFLKKNNIAFSKIEIISDSQYVVRILERKEKLKRNNFLTKKNKPIRNVELVKNLISKIESLPLFFTKIKAHQKKTKEVNYNRMVDVLAREQVRFWVQKTRV
ncbi:MAG TPA: ribonuclease HI [Phaeodactylibacter sp.]|nr:ribonuclease HI [Phaeodactylibacter sp.]